MTYGTQIYDSAWGGWRSYGDPSDFPSGVTKRHAQKLCREASVGSSFRYRVIDETGEPVTEYQHGRAKRLDNA